MNTASWFPNTTLMAQLATGQRRGVVPARAGVILSGKIPIEEVQRGTRASGGDPENGDIRTVITKWYPRERG